LEVKTKEEQSLRVVVRDRGEGKKRTRATEHKGREEQKTGEKENVESREQDNDEGEERERIRWSGQHFLPVEFDSHLHVFIRDPLNGNFDETLLL
jgi:hypothetical protein